MKSTNCLRKKIKLSMKLFKNTEKLDSKPKSNKNLLKSKWIPLNKLERKKELLSNPSKMNKKNFNLKSLSCKLKKKKF